MVHYLTTQHTLPYECEMLSTLQQCITGIYRDGTAIQMTFGNLRRQYVTIFGVAGAVTSKPKDIIMSEVKTYFWQVLCCQCHQSSTLSGLPTLS